MLTNIIIIVVIWLFVLGFFAFCIYMANKAKKNNMPKDKYTPIIRIGSFFVAEGGLGHPFKKQKPQSDSGNENHIGHDSGHDYQKF